MVRLFSSDNQEFSVSKEIACQSILVKNILEDLDNDQNAVIPLPNITGVVLAKVIQYVEHHKDDLFKDEPVKNLSEDKTKPFEKPTIDLDPWDKEFTTVDQSLLFDLIFAANYLNIKSLLNLGFKAVANVVKENTVRDICQAFPISSNEE